MHFEASLLLTKYFSEASLTYFQETEGIAIGISLFQCNPENIISWNHIDKVHSLVGAKDAFPIFRVKIFYCNFNQCCVSLKCTSPLVVIFGCNMTRTTIAIIVTITLLFSSLARYSPYLHHYRLHHCRMSPVWRSSPHHPSHRDRHSSTRQRNLICILHCWSTCWDILGWCSVFRSILSHTDMSHSYTDHAPHIWTQAEWE